MRGLGRAYEKVSHNFSNKAMDKIREVMPDFDQELFEEDVGYLFEKIYTEYQSKDLSYINKVCKGEGLAYFKKQI